MPLLLETDTNSGRFSTTNRVTVLPPSVLNFVNFKVYIPRLAVDRVLMYTMYSSHYQNSHNRLRAPGELDPCVTWRSVFSPISNPAYSDLRWEWEDSVTPITRTELEICSVFRGEWELFKVIVFQGNVTRISEQVDHKNSVMLFQPWSHRAAQYR